MTRREGANGIRLRERLPQGTRAHAPGSSRIDRLVDIVDHCTLARDVAEASGEKFLSYLIAMAIQECRTCMRQPSTIVPRGRDISRGRDV